MEPIDTGILNPLKEERRLTRAPEGEGVDISFIIPAKNEEYLIRDTLDAILEAKKHYQALAAPHLNIEVIVVDNNSEDKTAAYIRKYERSHGFQYLFADQPGVSPTRNAGARSAKGKLLVFIDADTLIPRESISRLWDLFHHQQFKVGIFKFKSLEGGFRGQLWWGFWNQVRRLPLPRAKALPAFMFCERETFFQLGPFDEEVQIAEEWPITAHCYRHDRTRFIYDRSLAAFSSNRRMELQKLGYFRTFWKYVWVVLHKKGRLKFTHTLRH